MPKKVKEYFTHSIMGYILVVVVGICVYLSISNFSVISNILLSAYKIVSPFVFAFIIAFLLNTPINWFENNTFKNVKYKKTLAIIVVYIIALICCGALAVAILPQVGDSVKNVMDNIPKYLTSIQDLFTKLTVEYNLDADVATAVTSAWQSLVSTFTSLMLAVIPTLLDVSFSIGGVIINTIMAIIASIYMLAGKDRLLFQVRKLIFAYIPYKRATRVLEIARRSNKIFTSFINGKLIDSLIIGIICFIGAMFIYPPYALLVAVIVGVTNMIPFFGPFIGAIPCVFILLMVKPIYAISFAIFVLVLQQFDGNILGPKILGDSTGLSALWVLAAIVVGGGLFGFPGMLIGVPTFAVIYGLVSENINKRLENKNIITDEKGCLIFTENAIDDTLREKLLGGNDEKPI